MQGRYRQVGEPRIVKRLGSFYSVGQFVEIDGQKAEVVEIGATEPRVVMGKRGNLETVTLKYPDGHIQRWLGVFLKGYLAGDLDTDGNEIKRSL